jgi:hypothetical protein
LSRDRETGELVGFALTCVGAVLLVLSAFVPPFPGSDQTLFDSRRVPDVYPMGFIAGGLLTALLAATAFLSEDGRYAVLSVVTAIGTYGLAIVLAWGDAIALDGRGPAIYLAVIGATVAATGAILSTLFAPDLFEPSRRSAG